MDTIKEYSKSRLREFSLDFGARDSLIQIEQSLLTRFLSTDQTYFDFVSELEVNDYSTYYYFDYQHFKQWVSFSVLADTESGFMELFQYTYHKKTGRITSCTRIGVYEGDGGASRIDYMKYDKSGTRLVNRSIYQYDEDIFDDEKYEDCYTRSSDSIVSKFQFYPDRVDYSIDTVRSWVDTICWNRK